MKQYFWNPPVQGVQNFAWLHRNLYENQKHKKILIVYQLWSKCVPVNLKRTPMTFKIKLTQLWTP